ncbi:MAG TPA: asparagine synthase (glutamine-hydrolyzing) [Steroidobacteraceae bacterium]|nr:asparagine synthase (glutamine-hydrolyzing) [Steroidobacteraceae bacterium]
MCGIVGLIRSGEITAADIAAVRGANSAMRHRGPDGEGEYGIGATALAGGRHLFMAMRRLSIIDLAHGWQPLFNEDRTIAVIANGEIYNYVELRQELLARGHRLQTHSDIEVIPHLYEEFGLDFVHRLRGMFALALWDASRRRLVLCRDRMGEKPLYLYRDGAAIWFASELKVLLASGSVPCELDPAAIDSYLHYGFIPEPRTAVAGVRKLPAGHLLVVDAEPWSETEHCYWRIEDAPPLSGDVRERVRAELDVVGRQIVRADVPIGVALSGGFDSSLVAALAVRNATDVHAFTAGYEGQPPQDERQLATRFAADLGMRVHELELSTSEMSERFPRLAFDRDDPVADIAGFGYYMLARRAHEAGCPVLLQGQGGDELLWGYSWAVNAVLHSERKIAGRPIGTLEALRGLLPTGLSRPQWVRFAYVIGGLLAGWRDPSPGRSSAPDQLVAYDLSDIFQIGAHAARATYARRFHERVLGSAARPADFQRRLGAEYPIDIQILALLCRGYLMEYGLAQGDRLSMASSVELRVPLVDYRLAETIVGLQKHKPLYRDRPKSLLIEAARDLVPDYVVHRPKRGFNPPVSQWIAALRLRFGPELASGALVATDVLDADSAIRLGRPTSRFDSGYDLFFKYLVLEYWYRGMREVARTARMDDARAA